VLPAFPDDQVDDVSRRLRLALRNSQRGLSEIAR
jgi:hypothetical protein